jgi:hypothetical protein
MIGIMVVVEQEKIRMVVLVAVAQHYNTHLVQVVIQHMLILLQQEEVVVMDIIKLEALVEHQLAKVEQHL